LPELLGHLRRGGVGAPHANRGHAASSAADGRADSQLVRLSISGVTMTSTTFPVADQREPELAGQTVVVIGGSAGIGLETARRARAEAADVILTGRNPDRLKQAAMELGAQRTAAFDVTDFGRLEQFFQELPTPIDHVLVTGPGP